MSVTVTRKVVCHIEFELEYDEEIKHLYLLLNEESFLPASLQELKDELEIIVSQFA
jgi:hypothetical protein